jgi:serine/threonine-protein kinase RsbW
VNQPDDVLTLSFPARSGYLRVCRITTTTYAADLGFDVDELDDLRLAVDEAVAWLLRDDDAGGDVSLTLQVAGPDFVVVGERHSDGVPAREIDDLVHAIMGATLDAYDLTSEHGHRSIRLQKATTDG